MTSKITQYLQDKSAQDRDSREIRARNERIILWKTSLESLYEDIESWLSESIALTDSNAISLMRIPTIIAEESIGPYQADKLLITVGGQTITAEPRGAFVLGANGRVDLLGSNGRQIILVLIDSSWCYTTLATRKPGADLPVLDEDGFLEALKMLLGE